MLEELILLEEQFRPYLLNQDYTFIGPVNRNFLERFIIRANEIAPGDVFDMSIHRVLSNRDVIRQVLNNLPAHTPLQIYVITRANGGTLFHSTIEDYCRIPNIQFPQD